MTVGGQKVLLLAGRLKALDEAEAIGSLLDRLAARGVSAQVLCTGLAAGVESHGRVLEQPALDRRWRRALAIRSLRLDPEGLREPDLLHVLTTRMSVVGLALAERWRIPYVQSVDEFLAPVEGLRLSRAWCRALVAASVDLADDLVRQWGVPARLISVVEPGVSIPENDAVSSAHRGLPVIGTAGPLVEASGFATFLNAARRILDEGLDAEFVIAGEGDGEVELRRRAERLRIADRVTFAARTVIGRRFWSVLDLYCQPATAPTVGRTLATALSFGVPTVASDVDGLRALIADGVTGLRVPPENTGALAEAIMTLIGDPARARLLGERGRELIRHDFDPDREADRLVSVYRGATGEGLTPPTVARVEAPRSEALLPPPAP